MEGTPPIPATAEEAFEEKRASVGRDSKGQAIIMRTERCRPSPVLGCNSAVSPPSPHTSLCSLALFCGQRGWDWLSIWDRDEMKRFTDTVASCVARGGRQTTGSHLKKEQVTTRKNPTHSQDLHGHSLGRDQTCYSHVR